VSAHLPGRAVDIVFAVAQRLDRRPYSISYSGNGIGLNLMGRVDEATGRAVFAALGVTDAVLGDRYGGGPQADLEGYVPALGMRLSIIIDDLPPQPELVDPAALIAQVDAARAATDEDAHQALVAGLLGALADSQAAIDADEHADGGEDR
jgi:hypothetical protein